jgi:tetratricopeptide (TPR) repeat protein
MLRDMTADLSLSDLLAAADRRLSAGRLAEAESLCRRALERDPNCADAVHALGLLAHRGANLGAALEHLRRAVALAPGQPVFHANLGEVCRLAGLTDEAVRAGRRAVELKPDYPEALSNLGIALYEASQFAAAADCHRRAVALRPDFALAHSNLGNTLYALKQFGEAAAAYRRAIALAPRFADAWANLGTTLHHAGHVDEAIATLRHALALDPRHANAHSGLGILLLMRGEFAEGWDEYEWRLASSEAKGARGPQRPWDGVSLAGRRIHVQAEQGFGDTLQFARYIPLLAARAGGVSLRVHQPLLALMRASLPGVEVLGDRGHPRPYDCDCALVSLPRLFKTRHETIPAPVSYLRVPADRAARLRPRLAALDGLKVGLAWAGNPSHANDFRRSLDLDRLAPLVAVAGTRFVSLQVGPRTRDARGRDDIVHVADAIVDFADTAAIIERLDLVVAVDSAVAHLAAGLGKPTWVLLPEVSDWRWLIGRDDSPWYPTLRLFRQQPGEPWSAVIARAAGELAAVVRGDDRRLAPFRAEGERRAARAAEIIALEAAALVVPRADTMPSAAQVLVIAEHRRAGQLGAAEELSRAAWAAAPSADAAHALGIIAFQAGRLDEAIDHLRDAIARDDGVALYHANLGEMLRLAGQRAGAIAHGERALALNPAYHPAWSNLGIAYYEEGRYQDALDCQERALALEPAYPQAHSNRGNALRALGRAAEAEPAYRRALALKPDFADAWLNLGTTLRELKRPHEAELAYQEALGLRFDDPVVLENLALALMDLDRGAEAEELVRRAGAP